MNLSSRMKKALKLLDQVKKNKLSQQEKEKTAVNLATLILKESLKKQTLKEKKQQKQLHRMMGDFRGKCFTTAMTDQCFRSHSSKRIADQLIYLLEKFGIPNYLSFFKRGELYLFRLLGPIFAPLLVPLVRYVLRKEAAAVILPGEKEKLLTHMANRKKEGVKLNLNHLGEAILGEEEALRRLQVYLDDLAQPHIEYISIKISTIYSQINLLAWNETLFILSDRLKQLYRAAMNNFFVKADGTSSPKFVNLDMEDYRDLRLTKELFLHVLNDSEFRSFSAGIVLQAYLPDSFLLQQELTEWACKRVEQGGAPIKIRLVKGANLATEQFEASLRGWPQAPYKEKKEVDANYKRMLVYGCTSKQARAVHLGIASHNLFDIAYAMILRAEHQIEPFVSFEMLEGMADSTRKAVQALAGEVLLYCPVAAKQDFQSAIGYLIRRLDENTGINNFLRHIFGLKPKSPIWKELAEGFRRSCQDKDILFTGPRRTQNRLIQEEPLSTTAPFQNEPDTDFSLFENRQWADEIRQRWQKKEVLSIPCVIEGKEIFATAQQKNFSPSNPNHVLYTYSLVNWEACDKALSSAKQEEISWQLTSVEKRAELLSNVARALREKRGDLICVMMVDGGKSFTEGDSEVSEAIDFAEYYLRSLLDLHSHQDIEWNAKGTVLVTPPWNFPIAIPTGGIVAALAAGNCVIFKPAPETVFCGWTLVNILWDAGISKQALQFVTCKDEPVGSTLISDPRVNAVILTGSTETSSLFLNLRPDLDLMAETGGKNALIITALADKDLAIKDLVHSAFSHSGQKCSAASLAILEKEVYDDPQFLRQLKDAVTSLKIGPATSFSSKITPLIHPPQDSLLKGLTILEPGESWLVIPKQDPQNPCLWSPGVKLGVRLGSFMQQTELFGPVLSVMRAEDLQDAITIASSTPFGLTSGIHSLDERELSLWVERIEAGNLYINRGITGAIVQRQPFGGCKASCFGPGAKAGGPNYLMQLMKPKQRFLPKEQSPLSPEVNALISFLAELSFSQEELGLLYSSLANYVFWSEKLPLHYELNQLRGQTDRLVGQDNALFYKTRNQMGFRIQEQDAPIDILRVIGAALSCKTPLEISWSSSLSLISFDERWTSSFPTLVFIEESTSRFLTRLNQKSYTHVRLISPPSDELRKTAASTLSFLDTAPVLANGRFELLRYVREVSISYDYQRYGNLGLREKEKRNPIL